MMNNKRRILDKWLIMDLRKRKFAGMALGLSRDYTAISKYPNAISSALISLALLVIISLNYSILLSRPVGHIKPGYLHAPDGTSHLDLSGSWVAELAEDIDHGAKSSVSLADDFDSSGSSSDEKVKKKTSSSQNDIVYKSADVSDGSECDVYQGEWYYDSEGPLYTNSSCPIITKSQNCLGNGRPDKEYENWRWKPSECDLPRFNATHFLELMSGKTVAFMGDSVARNQMESLLCILWQVEAPIYKGNRRMQRWIFESKPLTIIRIWSAWLVDTSKTLDSIPDHVAQVHLDVPDKAFMDLVPTFDLIIFNNGHWFTKSSAYMINNQIVGSQLWQAPPELIPHPTNITNTEAFQIATETCLTAIVTHPNYSGLTILTSYSPDHYENGAWNTGGSCTGKVRPLLPGQLVEHEYTNTMHEKQMTGFNQAIIKKLSNGSKLKFMDITRAFGYRHDGHPGPYRSSDPNKVTKRGPDGRPPPQDCLHWCMPGPVDVWNELMFEIIKKEFQSCHQKSSL